MAFDLQNWEAQLRKGQLELILLALLRGRERYGYELIAEAQTYLDRPLLEGTVYPVLNRMARDELVEHHWVVEDGVKPRKYFRLTSEGERTLGDMRERWQRQQTNLRNLLEG
ncbi:MAG: PadR family transcriptional regulator [Parvularcula sp.]|jgi:PadR family transcriptional regulator PadR|nr:PadR family transcriptional regulator [Parvularcula sp.]